MNEQTRIQRARGRADDTCIAGQLSERGAQLGKVASFPSLDDCSPGAVQRQLAAQPQVALEPASESAVHGGLSHKGKKTQPQHESDDKRQGSAHAGPTKHRLCHIKELQVVPLFKLRYQSPRSYQTLREGLAEYQHAFSTRRTF